MLRFILVLSNECQVLARGKSVQAEDIELVSGLDKVVISWVSESEGKHALLFQVGLMDAGEGADNDCKTTQEAGLQSGVLTRRTLTVVAVTNNNPLNALVTVVGGDFGNTAIGASKLVANLVGLAILSVDSTNQAVF
jgi:hypothetical protein